MNKDLLTLSLTIFRHAFGISIWTKSDAIKVQKKGVSGKQDFHIDDLGDAPEEQEKPAKK